MIFIRRVNKLVVFNFALHVNFFCVKIAETKEGAFTMDMSIAALAVDMKNAQVQQNFDVAVMKMAMDTNQESVAEELQQLESLEPYLGQSLDILA